jgi:hypothetical protein
MKSMNNLELPSLSFQEKIEHLKHQGSHLTTRTTPHYYIKLYSVEGYYVEVWTSSHLPWEGIVKIEFLSGIKMLEPYLEKDFFKRAMLQ